MLEEYRQAQARIAEEEKSAQARYGDYYQSIKRLEPGNESPIPPTSYCHLMLNVSNAPDVGYYLSRHPETIAKLWSLETSGQGVKALQELNDLSAGPRFQGSTAQTGAGSSAQRERQPRSAPPAPIRPVTGNGYSNLPDVRDPNLPYSEYKKNHE